MQHRVTACLFLTLAFSSTVGLADDLFPPPWRGLPYTTYAAWDFTTSNNPAPPDTGLAIIGDGGGGGPSAIVQGNMHWDPVFNGSWISGGGGGTMWFQIPNWIDDRPVKLIQIQITHQISTFPFSGISQVSGSDPLGISGIIEDSETTIPLDPFNGLVHRTEQWRIFPNPDNEWLLMDVPPDMAITQVVIDTWSVPEPSSLLLGALAGTGLLLRRNGGLRCSIRPYGLLVSSEIAAPRSAHFAVPHQKKRPSVRCSRLLNWRLAYALRKISFFVLLAAALPCQAQMTVATHLYTVYGLDEVHEDSGPTASVMSVREVGKYGGSFRMAASASAINWSARGSASISSSSTPFYHGIRRALALMSTKGSI